VRRGASWTAAYHLQQTVAAVPRPVRSSVVPSSSVLLSAPCRRPPSRRLPRGAAAGLQRSGIVAVIDTARTPPRRRSLVSGMRCPPSRFVVRHPAVQPSGVRPLRCPVTRVRRPGSADPARCCPPVQRPALAVHPVRCPALCCPPSVRSRPSPPTSGAGVGTRSRRPGNPHHSNRSRSLWRPQPRAAGSPAEEPWGQTALPRSCGGQSGVGGGPGRGGTGSGGRPCPLRDQAGRPACGAACGWR
jgi:hypothetical protein